MDLFIGITGSVVASILVAIAVALWRRRNAARRLRWRKNRVRKRLRLAGLSNFYASRSEYRYRDAVTLVDYLSTAKSTIKIAAYWMAYGTEAEAAGRSIAKLIQDAGVTADIAVIDPRNPCLSALAQYLDVDEEALRVRVAASLQSLLTARAQLGSTERARFTVRGYMALPMASVIMLDTDTTLGRIQLDFKPYHTPRAGSFGLELRAGGSLYETANTAWSKFIKAAPAIIGDVAPGSSGFPGGSD